MEDRNEYRTLDKSVGSEAGVWLRISPSSEAMGEGGDVISVSDSPIALAFAMLGGFRNVGSFRQDLLLIPLTRRQC